MSTRRVPFVMTIVEPSDADITVPNFTAVRGRRSNPIACQIVDGGHPAITMSEVATADIEWFTDSARNDALGDSDAQNYNHEIQNIDIAAGTFDVVIDLGSLTSAPANTTLYGSLVVEQG